ncbi:MAG: tRNA (adenosine(37)-N6)-threonylcarbamoyltransferase complex transferase subunit TsaD, partial [Anaerolineae bacterium]
MVHRQLLGKPEGRALSDFAASFQEAIVDTLVKKALLAARAERLDQLVVAGGVAANERLREKLTAGAQTEGCQIFFPPLELCTDNAAMVAALAEVYLA